MALPSQSSSASTTSTTSAGKRPSNAHTRLLRGGAPVAGKLLLDDTESTPLLPTSSHDNSPPPASDAKTFASAIISFLGSGVLGFPFAFKETGIILGMVLLLLIAALTAFCMLLIVECKYKIKASRGVAVSTYGEIGAIVLGRPGQWIVNFSLIVSQAGFSVAYLIFISANVNAYFGLSKQIVVLLCVPPLALFCLLRHIRQLAYVALVADIMNLTGLAVVYFADFSFMDLSSPAALESINWVGSLASVPFFFGVATYCFAGIGMALPLENAMEHKTHFRRVLLQTVALIATIYGSFGVCGYLAFGAATQDVVTLNIDGHGSLATSVKLCLCVGLLCACPLMLFPVFEVLQPVWVTAIRSTPLTARLREQSSVVLFRSLVVLAVATIAGAAPNFGLFISFIGSTCCAVLGFVLPVVFHLELFKDSHSPLATWLLRAITLLGLCAVAAGLVTAVHNLF